MSALGIRIATIVTGQRSDLIVHHEVVGIRYFPIAHAFFAQLAQLGSPLTKFNSQVCSRSTDKQILILEY